MSFVILSKPTSSASSSSQSLATSAGDMNALPPSAPPSAAPSTSHSREPSLGPSVSQVSSVNGSNPATPPPQTANGTAADAAAGENGNMASPNSNSSNNAPASPADVQVIIEALKSKDRIYVLKLGEQMESLIKERRQRVDLTPATSYQRLLVHRCSAYYKLAPENDPITKGISVHPTSESRIPDVRICELVPPESSSQPAFKIMRRSPPDRRAKPHSQAGSVAGEDADLSDVEPSEAGSLGGRSNATGSSTKKHMTIEERAAAYKEARSRIFNDFGAEPEKPKESQMSASSSSLSVNSTSASTSANGDNSSVGDVDGSVSSPTTESEWSVPSGPAHKERKDYRRGNASTSSSNRSVRSGGASYGSNNSSRNSRASSPSFTYASLYEPPPASQLYDPNQPANAYQGTQYYHPFTPPSQPPNGMYMPYPYYAPYPYQAPAPDPHQTAPDASSPQHYPPPPPPANYGGPFMWQPPVPAPSAAQSLPTTPQHGHPPPAHSMSPPPPPTHQYTYPPYGYPMPGYYPPPPPPGHPMPPPSQGPPGMPGPMYEAPRGPNGPPPQPASGHNSAPPYHSPYNQNGRSNIGNGAAPQQNTPRSSQRSQTLTANGSNGNKRNPPATARNPWNYPSGISPGGYSSPSSMTGSDTVGPRLNSSRRQSNNSSSSSYSRASSINDDVSSIASSSTTSSSSRRTYTSTASSQHPLPARPDWAVGLKAQPTLARDTGPRHAGGPISPSRSVNGSSTSLGKTPPLSLQPNDFPPLTPMAASQERRHVPNGAWGNAANRSILSPPGGTRSDDIERGGSERPSPKSTELYNPKLNRRFDTSKDGEAQSNLNLTEQLVNQIQSITIEEKIAAVELASTTSMVAVQSPEAPCSSSAPTGLSSTS